MNKINKDTVFKNFFDELDKSKFNYKYNNNNGYISITFKPNDESSEDLNKIGWTTKFFYWVTYDGFDCGPLDSENKMFTRFYLECEKKHDDEAIRKFKEENNISY